MRQGLPCGIMFAVWDVKGRFPCHVVYERFGRPTAGQVKTKEN